MSLKANDCEDDLLTAILHGQEAAFLQRQASEPVHAVTSSRAVRKVQKPSSIGLAAQFRRKRCNLLQLHQSTCNKSLQGNAASHPAAFASIAQELEQPEVTRKHKKSRIGHPSVGGDQETHRLPLRDSNAMHAFSHGKQKGKSPKTTDRFLWSQLEASHRTSTLRWKDRHRQLPSHAGVVCSTRTGTTATTPLPTTATAITATATTTVTTTANVTTLQPWTDDCVDDPIDTEPDNSSIPADLSINVRQSAPYSSIEEYLLRSKTIRTNAWPARSSGPPPLHFSNLIRNLSNRSYGHQGGAHLGSYIRHRSWSGYRQVSELVAFQTDLTGTASQHRPSSLVAMASSPCGSFLAAASATGVLALYDTGHLASASTSSTRVGTFLQMTGIAAHLAWEPGGRTKVVCSPRDPSCLSLSIYDLGRPEARASQYRLGVNATQVPPSLGPVTFLCSGPHHLAAGTSAGTVALWDSRVSSRHRGTLTHSRASSVTAIQELPGSCSVAVGTSKGEVIVWDIRGGHSSSFSIGGHGVSTGGMTYRTTAASLMQPFLPPVTSTSTAASKLPRAPVRAAVADPLDCNRLGLALANGCTGVLDIKRQALTHFDSHNDGNVDSESVWSGYGEVKCAIWSVDGRSFCTGSSTSSSGCVRIADFAPGGSSFCAVSNDGAEAQHVSKRGKIITSTHIHTAAPVHRLAIDTASSNLILGCRDMFIRVMAPPWAPDPLPADIL